MRADDGVSFLLIDDMGVFSVSLKTPTLQKTQSEMFDPSEKHRSVVAVICTFGSSLRRRSDDELHPTISRLGVKAVTQSNSTMFLYFYNWRRHPT